MSLGQIIIEYKKELNRKEAYVLNTYLSMPTE